MIGYFSEHARKVHGYAWWDKLKNTTNFTSILMKSIHIKINIWCIISVSELFCKLNLQYCMTNGSNHVFCMKWLVILWQCHDEYGASWVMGSKVCTLIVKNLSWDFNRICIQFLKFCQIRGWDYDWAWDYTR